MSRGKVTLNSGAIKYRRRFMSCTWPTFIGNGGKSRENCMANFDDFGDLSVRRRSRAPCSPPRRNSSTPPALPWEGILSRRGYQSRDRRSHPTGRWFRPRIPGETITIYSTGLGSYAGLYQLNIVLTGVAGERRSFDWHDRRGAVFALRRVLERRLASLLSH